MRIGRRTGLGGPSGVRGGSAFGPALALSFVVLAFSAPPIGAQVEPFRGWIPLFEDDRVPWLENQYRADELCADAADLDRCRSDLRTPRIDIHRLHVEPDADSEAVGELIVTSVPGTGFRAFHRPAGSTEAVPFRPDLFLQDWGYGPYFHQTVLAVDGPWVRLPADPWDSPVWMRRDAPERRMTHVHAGSILEMDDRGMFVVETAADSLLLRPEQEADMWCHPDDPPPLEPADPVWFTRERLSDARGHLRIRPKYMKGC